MTVVNAYSAVGSEEQPVLAMIVIIKLVNENETMECNVKMMAIRFGMTRHFNVN